MHLDTYADYLRQVDPRTGVESCASTTNDGWPSHEETSWTLLGGLWAVSNNAERGWNQHLHQDLHNNR